MAAGQFNRRGAQNLIEGRLGRPIGNPSAQSIVTDRSHPRREDRDPRRTITRQKSANPTQNERWTYGIYQHLCRHSLRRRGLDGLFWHNPAERQSAGGNDNCVKRTRDRGHCVGDGLLLRKIQTLRFARQAGALPTLILIGLSKRRSNGPRGTDDQDLLHGAKVRRIADMATTTPHFDTNCISARTFGIFFPFPFGKSQVYLRT